MVPESLTCYKQPEQTYKVIYMVNVLKFEHSLSVNRPGQTVQTQIRLLLKKQSDQGLPCLLL